MSLLVNINNQLIRLSEFFSTAVISVIQISEFFRISSLEVKIFLQYKLHIIPSKVIYDLWLLPSKWVIMGFILKKRPCRRIVRLNCFPLFNFVFMF